MTLIAAAQYLRVSTERQEYSLELQSAAISTYAAEHGFTISQTYCDEARSGLHLARRAALSQLLRDVVSGSNQFRAVLVYDVSRWGRFQNPDESAHYEFLCKASGVPIHYCAEQFPNGPDPRGAIMKALKRVMAGEYSRELSRKVSDGLARVVRNGFRPGGEVGYGFRRMLISPTGVHKQELQPGERKNLTTDRVVAVLGPAEELFWVREIFRMFVHEANSFKQIARELRSKNAPFLQGRVWTDYSVKRVLTHPKYMGTMIYNRTTEKLGGRVRRVPQSQWIVREKAFEPIVSPELFRKAQAVLRQKSWNRSDQEIVDQLRSILHTHGYLCQSILRKYGLSPGYLAYRFGSSSRAYRLVGYETPYKLISEHRHQVKEIREELIRSIVEMFPKDISVQYGPRKNRNWLKLQDGPEIAVRVCRSVVQPRKGRQWRIQVSRRQTYPLTLIAGLDPSNTSSEAFYLVKRLTNRHKIHVSEQDDLLKHAIRLHSLGDLCVAAWSAHLSGTKDVKNPSSST